MSAAARRRTARATTATVTSPTFVDADGEPADCDDDPTVTATRDDGTALDAPDVASIEGEDGIYSATLTHDGHTNRLDELTLVWVGEVAGHHQEFTQLVEVVGAHYVTLAELRAQKGIEDPAKFPAWKLAELRDEFADNVERICDDAFVRRYQRDELAGGCGHRLALTELKPRTVLAVTVDGVAQDPAEFTFDGHHLVWTADTFPAPTTATGPRNVTVVYERGDDAPPAKLRGEALRGIRSDALAWAAEKDGGRGEISSSFEGVTIRFSTPDPARGRPTGVLTLDPVLVELMQRAEVLA